MRWKVVSDLFTLNAFKANEYLPCFGVIQQEMQSNIWNPQTIETSMLKNDVFYFAWFGVYVDHLYALLR